MAYPGDPILYHAQFCVRVQHPAAPLHPFGLAAAARVAHTARKHLLLASVDDTQWGGPPQPGGGEGGRPPVSYLTIAPETQFGRAYNN